MRRLTLLILCAVLSCSKEPTAARPVKVEAPDLAQAPAVQVDAAKAGYVYRYCPAGSRKAEVATRLDAIPEAARDLVVVVPDDVQVPPGVVYVADLRGATGPVTARPVLSAELDQTLESARGPAVAAAAAPTPSAPSKPAAGAEPIILYSASWCGVCKQARRYFENKGLPFVEKDIEQDEGARDEMLRHADEAQVPRGSISGVPVIWVKRRLLMGFDAAAIERLLRS